MHKVFVFLSSGVFYIFLRKETLLEQQLTVSRHPN
jgi:hypothetical protein